jgi:hypothetical protein
MTKREKQKYEEWKIYVNVFLWGLGISLEEEE